MRDPFRIAMLTVSQILFHDRSEPSVKEEPATESIEQGREPRDRSHENEPTGSNDATRLLQRTNPIGPVCEVLERTEQ